MTDVNRIDPSVRPSGAGCVECDARRRLLVLFGCCDDSPAKHATGHFRHSGHLVIRS